MLWNNWTDLKKYCTEESFSMSMLKLSSHNFKAQYLKFNLLSHNYNNFWEKIYIIFRYLY